MRTIWIIPLALTVACSHSSEHDHHTHSHGPAEHSQQEHASEVHAEEHREEVHLLDRQIISLVKGITCKNTPLS